MSRESRDSRNPFQDFLDALCEGSLGHNHVQIAYRAWLRQRRDLPDGIKGLLGGTGDADAGLVYKVFNLISCVTGTLELAYRRGYQAGLDDARRKRRKKGGRS